MEYLLEHKKPFWSFTTGADLEVSLYLEDSERDLIRCNNLLSSVIYYRPDTIEWYEDENGKQQKRQVDLYLSDFLETDTPGTSITSWHFDSKHEADLFELAIVDGFRTFHALLIANSTAPSQTYEDFTQDVQPFSIALVLYKRWFEHAHVLADSGGGKTQLLQTIFLQFATRPNPPGFIIVDSQNKMLPLIKRKFPNAIHIDPERNPPSIGLFNVNLKYGDKLAFNHLKETFVYLFEANGEPLTGRQLTVFVQGLALMVFGYPAAFGRPATLEDFEDFFRGQKKGRKHSLSANAAQAAQAMPEPDPWYENSYEEFEDGCERIMQRLENIVGKYSALRDILKGNSKDIDFSRELNKGGIILINTNRHFLGKSGAAFFGRYFIKLLEQQMHARDDKSHPLFFMIDEAQEYFNETINDFTDQARKRNIAAIFAHQRLSQLTTLPLYTSLTSLGVRFAGGLNDHDVDRIAGLYRTSPDFISSHQKEPEEPPRYADFAFFIRGSRKPDSFRLFFGQLEDYGPWESHFEDVEDEPAPKQEAPKNENWDAVPFRERIHPKTARDGGIIVIILVPANDDKEIPAVKRKVRIPAGTQNGWTIVLRGDGGRRPDGTLRNIIVTLDVPAMPETEKEQPPEPPPTDDETDAKPW